MNESRDNDASGYSVVVRQSSSYDDDDGIERLQNLASPRYIRAKPINEGKPYIVRALVAELKSESRGKKSEIVGYMMFREIDDFPPILVVVQGAEDRDAVEGDILKARFASAIMEVARDEKWHAVQWNVPSNHVWTNDVLRGFGWRIIGVSRGHYTDQITGCPVDGFCFEFSPGKDQE